MGKGLFSVLGFTVVCLCIGHYTFYFPVETSSVFLARVKVKDLDVVLIYIFPIAKDIAHFFIYLFVICISFENDLLNSFAHLLLIALFGLFDI